MAAHSVGRRVAPLVTTGRRARGEPRKAATSAIPVAAVVGGDPVRLELKKSYESEPPLGGDPATREHFYQHYGIKVSRAAARGHGCQNGCGSWSIRPFRSSIYSSDARRAPRHRAHHAQRQRETSLTWLCAIVAKATSNSFGALAFNMMSSMPRRGGRGVAHVAQLQIDDRKGRIDQYLKSFWQPSPRAAAPRDAWIP